MEEIFVQIQQSLSWLPHELQVFFLAMLPITELRAAIPIGITLFKLPPEAALIWGVLGNTVPTILILLLLGPVCGFLMRHSKFFHNFFTKLFHKTRDKHTKNFDRYGTIFLVIFVAIPIPGSGAWTGALLAFLFGIPFKKAAPAIIAGITGAGLILTLGVETITGLVNLLG